MKTIEIIVTPKGETKLQTKGFAGAECQEASRFLEEALGCNVNERLTSEFYAAQPAANQQQLQQP